MANQTFQAKLLSVQRNLLNFAYTLTSNRDDAYDLLQDTTLKALDNEDTPEGSVAMHEINRVIAGFAPEYRVPFSMFVAGYKYAEIAQRMGLPLGTVKSRIFLARKKLQAILSDYRYGE